MGTPTAGLTVSGSDSDVKVRVKQEPDNTFYDDDFVRQLKPEPIEEEPEFSDLESEMNDDDDTDSMVSSFSNDHNYNMSPVSRISSPETCPTSDPGYESQPSPPTSAFDDDVPIINLDEFDLWNQISDPITELFPSLA